MRDDHPMPQRGEVAFEPTPVQGGFERDERWPEESRQGR
jgi:hypothetical protein